MHTLRLTAPTPHGLCDVSLTQEVAEAKTSGQTDPRPFISDLHALLKTPMKPFTAPVRSLSGSEEGGPNTTYCQCCGILSSQTSHNSILEDNCTLSLREKQSITTLPVIHITSLYSYPSHTAFVCDFVICTFAVLYTRCTFWLICQNLLSEITSGSWKVSYIQIHSCHCMWALSKW